MRASLVSKNIMSELSIKKYLENIQLAAKKLSEGNIDTFQVLNLGQTILDNLSQIKNALGIEMTTVEEEQCGICATGECCEGAECDYDCCNENTCNCIH